jgi:hypothetical protein
LEFPIKIFGLLFIQIDKVLVLLLHTSMKVLLAFNDMGSLSNVMAWNIVKSNKYM